jgi:L-serine dehydratase
MESIKEIYRIGHGPSSSHTMGPKKAAESFIQKIPDAPAYRVTLYGTLAATGKGHLTDLAIMNTFGKKKLDIVWAPKEYLKKHPNALKFEALDKSGSIINDWTAYSIGGGAIIDDTSTAETKQIYQHHTLTEILGWCEQNGKQLWEYVDTFDDKDVWDHLEEVWQTMQAAIKRGLATEGSLPGGLKLARKASSYHQKAKAYSGPIQKRALLFSYALAVSEENASGGKIVTAPTCGACAVMPAVLLYHQKTYKISHSSIIKALATAGLIGNLVKRNASISGADVGCQGEVGTACAMASGAATQMMGGSIYQVEYSSEMGLEHHLGLTCDPILGLVQIPCIERNAFAAARALNHNTYALLSDGRHRISFDQVVETMKKTGHDLSRSYKETSLGGLALHIKDEESFLTGNI